jgi:hypothetical protein
MELRHWTYSFFEDIISYHLLRPKKWYNILSYITAKKGKDFISYIFTFKNILFMYLAKNAYCKAKVPQNWQICSKKDIG